MVASPFRVLTFALAASTSLSACDSGMASGSGSAAVATKGAGSAAAQDLDPLLAEPRVGDLWSGELTAFSSAEFNQGASAPSERAFGAMKVVRVDDARITVITEQGAWDNANDAKRELRGDLSGITWDPSEEIPVNRADLARLVAEGKITETRRMDGAGS